jgi:DNA repair protein RecO (recombination protein O)
VSDRPRTYKTEGVILRRRNIGEADSIFTVFSDREGKFDGVARGVRKARSHMRGHLEPLTRTRVMLARGRSMDVFTQAEAVASYRAVREDLERGAAAMYCAELVDRFTAEHIEQPGVYALLVDLLEALEAGTTTTVTRYFELQLLALTGYELQLDACAACGARLPAEDTLFAAAAGGLVCVNCRVGAGGGRLIGVRTIKVLRFARDAAMADFGGLRMDERLLSELQYALADAVRYVLERDPATGRYVEQVARLTPAASPEPAIPVE